MKGLYASRWIMRIALDYTRPVGAVVGQGGRPQGSPLHVGAPPGADL
ncbi:MAG TPA: hypothetical protein VIY29_17565 [Ktedonobacteraceae bacterium]